jgi:Asp-tRNA(Asn)/Glu-tRNA(Gln) amidotransferase C subunit
MSVERKEAEQIASLARLRFDGDELTRITGELNHILEHVQALRSLETASPEQRGDEAEGDSTRGAGADAPDQLHLGLPDMAPDWRHGFFVVPPLPGMHDDGSA